MPIIAMQLFAVCAYFVGSRKFYTLKENFLHWILIGIVLDVIMTIIPFIFQLPRMPGNSETPWDSLLFLLHISMAGGGMFGFIIIFLYLYKNGTNYYYRKLRKFQYKVLFPVWFIGVSIALVNFLIKVLCNIRIYDYF